MNEGTSELEVESDRYVRISSLCGNGIVNALAGSFTLHFRRTDNTPSVSFIPPTTSVTGAALPE